MSVCILHLLPAASQQRPDLNGGQRPGPAEADVLDWPRGGQSERQLLPQRDPEHQQLHQAGGQDVLLLNDKY